MSQSCRKILNLNPQGQQLIRLEDRSNKFQKTIFRNFGKVTVIIDRKENGYR